VVQVIKSQQKHSVASFDRTKYSLAYMQVQLAGMSLLVMGAWALGKDYTQISERGLWHNVNGVAALAIVNSALGGLTVAAVLKFADSVKFKKIKHTHTHAHSEEAAVKGRRGIEHNMMPRKAG